MNVFFGHEINFTQNNHLFLRSRFEKNERFRVQGSNDLSLILNFCNNLFFQKENVHIKKQYKSTLSNNFLLLEYYINNKL